MTDNQTAPAAADADYSGDAYRACLYGKADRNQQQSAAAQIALLHGVKGELIGALESARHALACLSGLRATDLSERRIAELIAKGRQRSTLEFDIDNGDAIGRIDATIARTTGAA